LILTVPFIYEPPLKEYRYAITLSSDVLPDPLGPRIATISQGFTYPDAQETTYLNSFLPLRSTLLYGNPFSGFE
jgi:hypothetical protein